MKIALAVATVFSILIGASAYAYLDHAAATAIQVREANLQSASR